MKGLILTYLLTYGGAVASLVNPFIGLLVYVAFAILRPQALWAYSLPSGGRLSLVVALALLAGWTLHGFGSWKFGRALPVVVALLLFWASIVVSAFFAIDSTVAWPFVENMSKLFLPCIVAITVIDSVSKLKQLVWVIVICQGFLAYEFNVQYYYYSFNDREWSFASMDNNGHAIAFVLVLGLAFFLGLYSKPFWQKLLAFLIAALMTHFVLFSMSRGGMLGMVIMGLVIFYLIPKKPAHLLIFALGVGVGLRLAGDAVIEEFMSIKEGDAQGVTEGETAFSRTMLWKACIDAGLAHPVTGVGPANWRVVAESYGFTRGKASHTTWLNILAEEGFPGLLSVVSFFGLCILGLWPLARNKRPLRDPWLGYFSQAVIASLIGFAISAQFVAIEGLEQAYYVAIVGAGVLKLNSLLPEPTLRSSHVVTTSSRYQTTPHATSWV